MTKGSKTVVKIRSVSNVPVKTTVTFKGGKGGGGGKGKGSYQTKSRISYGDKQTGCYGRSKKKEKMSAREFQCKNGQSGTKREYKKSSTVRVGDKSGYTEIYTEQKVRNVSYNNSKNKITYHNDDGYGYCYCSDSDFDSDY